MVSRSGMAFMHLRIKTMSGLRGSSFFLYAALLLNFSFDLVFWLNFTHLSCWRKFIDLGLS